MTYNALYFKNGTPAKIISWDRGWKIIESTTPELFTLNSTIDTIARFFGLTLDELELKEVELIIKQ